VNGAILWANLHLLFWLSLVPFVTGWMDENHFAALPVAAYGMVLLGAACAYTILTRVLLAAHTKDSPLAKALGRISREDLARHLRRRASARFRASVDRVRPLRTGRRDLAGPGPALRETARRSEGVATMDAERIKVRVTETGQLLDVVVYSKRADRIEIVLGEGIHNVKCELTRPGWACPTRKREGAGARLRASREQVQADLDKLNPKLREPRRR